MGWQRGFVAVGRAHSVRPYDLIGSWIGRLGCVDATMASVPAMGVVVWVVDDLGVGFCLGRIGLLFLMWLMGMGF